MCDSLSEAEYVPAFARESKRGTFVREAEKRNEKRLGDKIYGGNFAGVFPSADIVGFTENREMYVYKSTAESRIANVVDWSDSAGSTRPRCGRGRKAPCFGVWAAVCDFLSEAECVPTFACESERGPFVGEVEKRDEKRFETALRR